MDSQADGTLRYGAPAAVVDPLLSFLYDLRRIEEVVLSSLEHMGVNCCDLPTPFRTFRTESAGHSPGEDKTRVGEESTAPTSAPASTSPPLDPLGRYARTVFQDDAVATVQRVLGWLDAHADPHHPNTPTSQHLLLSFVAAAVSGRDAWLREVGTREEVHVELGRKRHRGDTRDELASPRAEEKTLTDGTGPKEHLVSSLTAAEMRATARGWRQYEKLLSMCTEEMESTIVAVTTLELGRAHRSHAKWIEEGGVGVGKKSSCILPASTVLKQNYESIMRLNDALATCQSALHTAYVTLEDQTDIFLEEALVVERQERVFQAQVTQAKAECAALQALCHYIRRSRKVLEKALKHGVCFNEEARA